MTTYEEPQAGTAEGAAEPPAGRIFVVSCTVGGILSFVAVTLGVLASGQEWPSAVALGLFTAFWGGLGFGSMIGGVIYATRLERHG